MLLMGLLYLRGVAGYFDRVRRTMRYRRSCWLSEIRPVIRPEIQSRPTIREPREFMASRQPRAIRRAAGLARR